MYRLFILALSVALVGCGDHLVVVKFPIAGYNAGTKDSVFFVVNSKKTGPAIPRAGSLQFTAEVAVGREYGPTAPRNPGIYSADVSVSVMDAKTGQIFMGPVLCYLDKDRVNTLSYGVKYGAEYLACNAYW